MNAQDQLEEARKQYGKGRLVVVDDGDDVFAFRSASRDMISDIQSRLAADKTGKSSLMILTNFCEVLCVVGKDRFKQFAADYPLMIANGDEGDPDGDPSSISSAIMRLARGKAKISVS